MKSIQQDLPSIRSRWIRPLVYCSGEGANSLIMNGLNAFAMLFYTEALGLSPALAGLALSLSVFWEAFSEPIMGFISDSTRSRFGTRHPWMLLGGLLMAASFYMMWAVPGLFRENQSYLFFYLLAMNLILRTGLTIFFIPYVALGFEVCPGYDGRARLQGLRQICNMAANLIGPALAWSIFFSEGTGPGSTQIKGTSGPANYQAMGTVFAAGTLILVLLCVFGTRHAIRDSRKDSAASGSPFSGFIRELKTTGSDENARWLFVFTFLACASMVLVSSLSMYLYVHFMKFSALQKSFAHGSTMVGAALGAALATWFVKKVDKRGTVMLGAGIGIVSNTVLAVLFLYGLVPKGGTQSTIIFSIFHGLYWFGSAGLLLPIATAMVGDAADLRKVRTGHTHDGSYASVFSLAMRLGIAVSFAGSGWILTGIGFDAHTQSGTSPEVIWRLGAAGLMAGPIVCVLSMLVMTRYRMTRHKYNQMYSEAMQLSGLRNTSENAL